MFRKKSLVHLSVRKEKSPARSSELFFPYLVVKPPETGLLLFSVIILMTPASASLPHKADEGPFPTSFCPPFLTETRPGPRVPEVLQITEFHPSLTSVHRD